jgi:hypothetical protein
LEPSEKRPNENVKQNVLGGSKNGQTRKIVKKEQKKNETKKLPFPSLLDLYSIFFIWIKILIQLLEIGEIQLD